MNTAFSHLSLFILLAPGTVSGVLGQAIPIRTVQFTTDPAGISPLLGQNVTVAGKVTASFEEGFVISDSAGAWHSVYVRTDLESPDPGQAVELTGLVHENQGMTEIQNLTAYTVLSDTGSVDAVMISAGEAPAEQYESVLIGIAGAKVISYEGNGEWMVEDSSGTVLFDDLNDYVYFPRVGDSLAFVKGILFYSFGNFKIEPRSTGDFSCARIPHYVLRGDLVTMNDSFDVLPNTCLEITGDRITGISQSPPAGLPLIQVQGFIFPGFIDAHNHPNWNVMDFTPYDQLFLNRDEWRNSYLNGQAGIQHSGILNEGGSNNQLPNVVKMAEIRALCAGTTMIQGGVNSATNHQGIGINNAERFPCRIKSEVNPLDYSYSAWQTVSNLNWERFVIHLCEGTDQQSLNEFTAWKNLDMLDHRTTIIHGTALSPQEFAEMAAVNASLVWSPKSNWVLYGSTTDIPAALSAGVNVSLAPDWTLSGERDILREMKFAERINKAAWNQIITPRQFASFITRNAAWALGQEDRIGTLAAGFQADLAILPVLDADPYESLMMTEARDVLLTVVSGRPMYGDPSLMNAFPFAEDLETVSVEGTAKAVGIRVVSPAIPEAEKYLADIENEIKAAYHAAGPKVCRFLPYAPDQDDPWKFKESGLLSDLCAVEAVTGDRVWASGRNGKVIGTTNGGSTWSVLSGGLDSLHYTVLETLDGATLYIAGHIHTASDSTVKIYRSQTAGQSWNNVYSSATGKINDLTMFDDENGIAVGDPVNGTWTTLKTDDGGFSWVQMPGAPLQSGDETGFSGCVHWEDSLNGWFGTSGSRIYHTVNGGGSWAVIHQPAGIGNIQKMTFSETGQGYISGDGILAKTSDHGATWQHIPSPAYGTLDLLTWDNGILWAADAGTGLNFSTNNGDSWETSNITLYRLQDIASVKDSPEKIWVAGVAGAIFHHDSFTAGIPEPESTGSFHLGQNYPNPFRHSTTIHFYLQEPAQVNLRVLNLLGQAIGTLIDQPMPAGFHQLEFIPAKIPCGVYLYRIAVNGCQQTKYMILIP